MPVKRGMPFYRLRSTSKSKQHCVLMFFAVTLSYLGVSVGNPELNASDVAVDHVVHGVRAATAHPKDLRSGVSPRCSVLRSSL